MEMDKPVKELYDTLVKNAPTMTVGQVNRILETYQETYNVAEKGQLCIMVMMNLLGFNSSAYLGDKEIARRIKNADDTTIQALRMAINFHGGYACSPFTPKDFLEKMADKHKMLKTEQEIKSYRDGITSILNEDE